MTEVFISRVTDLLDKCKTAEAIQLLKEDHLMTENNLCGIMSAIVPNLTSPVLQHHKAMFDCCLNVLTFLTENCEPTIAVIEFPRYLKRASDHVNFCTILGTMQTCLMLVRNKSKTIDWYFDAIKMYLEDLPLPDEADDPEAASDRIVNTYKAIIVFLEPLVQEAIDINSKQEKGSLLGNHLLNFFIFLCGKPFCCLNKYISEEITYKEIADNIVTQALYLTGDILYFLDTVSKRQRESTHVKTLRKYLKTNIESSFCSTILDWSQNISNMAYANFYFYVITQENYWINVPQIYNSYYILETCAYFFKILLSEDYSISTGLIFMENVIKRISLRSLDSEMLSLEIYTELFQPITTVMIYSNSDEQRKKAVRIFQDYIEIFNMEARYTIILYLYENIEHSGLLSFITGIFKSSIIECLDSTPRNPQFLGKNMELLLKKICNLSHGSSSDVVEISDEIITALNLLRFLFIRDKNNETGIWNMTDMLKTNYLNPLREGIDLCRAHWRVKKKDLEQQKKDLAKNQDYSKLMKAHMEVTLTIGFRRLWTSRALLTDQFESDNRKAESHRENDEEYENNIKLKILGASLKFVPDVGWSKQAISAGAESIGYPGVIHGLFPKGSAALVEYFYSMCNRELNDILEKEALAVKADSSSSQKTPEQQVRDAVEIRLRMVIPYKKTWPQAMAIMSLPPNVLTALANLLILVDDICYYAGDRSVDINWYARRMILATIYKATELYMLQDKSEDHKETWLFLERRLKDILQIQTMLSSSVKPDEALNCATETASAVFITVD
ncbi:Ubiquinone biosynthesis protein COQ9, mitochondrial [Trachymyrmex cornetzi]|uniref:Ubiquinone biosynthesis protein n=1 Tax=Trachymyrmex cornetzi TaxID=471704 RepID=A0A195DJ38_9HYME|nr:Ubiquinone biosynthesis protein COQ9, mitochondrial [Trachymyrmex cornetzi]